MPLVPSHAPGTPAWVELCTADLPGALAFYGPLFGWTGREVPVDDAGAFVMLRRHGVDVAAAYALGPRHREKELSAHWLIYFASADVDETAAKVRGAQGGVVFGPGDVGALGRSAVCVDRHGAMFGVWQARHHPGIGITGEPGTLYWPQLASPDMAASRRFYGAVFGWGVSERETTVDSETMIYTEWQVGGKLIGGGLQMTAAWKGIPPHWMPYFQVEDCAESCRKIAQLGGTVMDGPHSISGVGRFAMVLDPQEAALSILELEVTPAPGERSA